MLSEKPPAVATAVGERLDTDEVRAFYRLRIAACAGVVIGARRCRATPRARRTKGRNPDPSRG